MTTLPSELYQYEIAANKITESTNQLQVLKLFDHICLQLNAQQNAPTNRLKNLVRHLIPPKKIQGLYLWGDVGVGKTYLMDLFYRCVQVPKLRIHFHAFMQRVHLELRQLQGQKNPLKLLGKKISTEARVLCFDEFHVNDIADAMLLGELLKSLIHEGVCFIASSNTPPDDLYKEGLQRERFLDAIQLIKEHSQVFYLHSPQDYRLQHLHEAGVYYVPADEAAHRNLENSFHLFSKNEPVDTTPLRLFGHMLPIIKQADQTIWFDFMHLCSIPRSQNDYLALAKNYRTWLISDIPIIQSHQTDLATNFIHLIDVLYDSKIRVVISAATSAEFLYPKGRLVKEFQRTRSRLIEMQSEDYFSPGMQGPELTTL